MACPAHRTKCPAARTAKTAKRPLVRIDRIDADGQDCQTTLVRIDHRRTTLGPDRRTSETAGHGFGTGMSEQIDDDAHADAFLLSQIRGTAAAH